MENKELAPETTGPFKDAKVIHTLPWNSEAITSVAFVGNDKVAAANKRGDILIWNLSVPDGKTPDPVRLLAGHSNEVNRIIVTPDGKTLISVSCDHTVKYWDALSESGDPGKTNLSGIVRKAVIALDAKALAPPEPVEVDVVVQKPTRELTGHKEWVYGLALTPDGKTLITGDDEGVVIVWDLAAGRELRRWQSKYWARALGISPDGKTVALSEYFSFRKSDPNDPCRAFKFWDVATGEPKLDLSKEVKETMTAVKYSADGKWLAVCCGDSGEEKPSGKVMLLEPETGKIIRELAPPHPLGAADLAYHPDGKHLFSAGRDQLVKIWQLEDGKHLRDLGNFKERGDWICAISISPDGHLLAAADMKGQIVVYSLTRSAT
ncbi:MAG: WD40 repeat protein [Hyphomicrobiaceae bacterium]|jgi:WD40 repeat protein